MVNLVLDANQIKIKLIDFLLTKVDSNLIASEVAFYQGYRKADLIQLASNKITAFEIKSDKDNLHKLPEQLNDYQNTFSFCYLVTTEKHLKNARSLVPQKTGIILIKNGQVEVLRKPMESKRLSKHSLTLGLSGKNIKSLIGDNQKHLPIHHKRTHIEEKTTLTHLKRCFYEDLLEKYQKRYNNFLADRGLKTSMSDLYYLQSN